MMKFVRKHWIGTWIIASILYALAIHVLFSFTTDNRFIMAHWSAGEILTYASTVSLGLLALWQNKKIQEENDIAQKKLESIIDRSNEINIVSKIIEHEERRFAELQSSMGSFLQNCDPQALALALTPNDKIAYLANLTELERRIDKNFFDISRLLTEDETVKNNDQHPLKKAFACAYNTSKQEIHKIQIEETDIYNEQHMKKTADMMANVRNSFMAEKEKYLSFVQERLNRILFENLSLSEIRTLFKNDNIL